MPKNIFSIEEREWLDKTLPTLRRGRDTCNVVATEMFKRFNHHVDPRSIQNYLNNHDIVLRSAFDEDEENYVRTLLTETDYSYKEIAKMFCFKFGRDVTWGSIASLKKRLGLEKKSARGFSDEQDEWLRNEYDSKDYTKLTEEFNRKFGTNKTANTLSCYCFRSLGLKVGNNERYRYQDMDKWLELFNELGGTMPVSEIVGEFNERYGHDYKQETLETYLYRNGLNQSKFGVKNGVYWSMKPIGHEKKGTKYMMVKVGLPNVYRYKHDVLWEKYNGIPKPKGYRVTFLNGDKNDFREENLKLVSIGNLARINKEIRSKLITDDKEMTELVCRAFIGVVENIEITKEMNKNE